MRFIRRVELGDSRAAVVRELRVMDVRNLMAGYGSLPEIAEPSRLQRGLVDLAHQVGDGIEIIGAPMLRLKPPQAEAVWSAWLEINRTVFEDTQGKRQGATDPLADLDRVCALLIERGHTAVGDYGWRFFQAVLQTIKP